MRKTWSMALWFALFLLPAGPVMAKPLTASSSELDIVVQGWPLFLKIKAWLGQLNLWFEETLGIDLYSLAKIVVSFTIVAFRLLAQFLLQVLEWLRGFLAL